MAVFLSFVLMLIDLRVTVTGADQLIARYKNAEIIIRDSLTVAMNRIVIFGESVSKRLVAKDTRNLARSITHRVESSVGRIRGIWGTSVFYGPYVEKGTRPHFPPPSALAGWARRHGANPFAVARGIAKHGTRAQPFIKPALEQTRGKALADLRAAARRAFKLIQGG